MRLRPQNLGWATQINNGCSFLFRQAEFEVAERGRLNLLPTISAPFKRPFRDPDLGGEIVAREGVEGGGAGAAAEGSVGDGLDVAVVADRGDAGHDGDDALAGFDFVARPDVPRHPD
ncbi:BnaCnng33770D [Brassica napus]|uniref:(rape) hypothetical protein n=1 Tax=Brassica napus TaxID=3708 RepID=A0A078J0Q0_BRANA|nr:unnamed protein product [Brassica napus]CDY58775.1 BnaCnng33770D [Brassica napus]